MIKLGHLRLNSGCKYLILQKLNNTQPAYCNRMFMNCYDYKFMQFKKYFKHFDNDVQKLRHGDFSTILPFLLNLNYVR